MEPMKAITLWQPWAQLAVIGEKLIETRGWHTSYRGQIAIHAAKSEPKGALLHLPDHEVAFFQAAGVREMSVLPRGVVLGTVEITDCVPIEKLYGSQYDTPKERAFGDWRRGRCGWILKDPVMFEKPIPARGGQRLWTWAGEQA